MDRSEKAWSGSAERLDVSSRIEFLGWLPQRQAIEEMSKASVVVMPTRHNEGFGLALVEAILSGTTIVASRIPIFEEIAGSKSERIHFFEDGVVESLATTLNNLLSVADDNYRRSHHDTNSWQQLFSTEQMSESNLNVYSQMLHNSKHCPADFDVEFADGHRLSGECMKQRSLTVR